MLDLNKIYCGDNLTLIKQLDDDCIDLTVTSPPYDNLRTYNGFTWDFEGLAEELYRVTKDGGVVVWVVGDATINGSETGTSFRQALYFMECGFRLHDTMIYQKDSISFPEINRYYQIFEYMFIFSKNKPQTHNLIKDRENIWANGKKHIKGNYITKDGIKHRHNSENLLQPVGIRYNIWRISTGKNKSTSDNLGKNHPAIFPEELVRDHIISWSNPGDIVLDPFMGSGTTAKMAIETGRKYIGFEISKEYVDLANKRIEQKGIF